MWWIPAVMGAVQMGMGAIQSSQAGEEAKKAREQMAADRPGVPESAERMVSEAERAYTEGASLRREREAIGEGTAAGVSALREGSVSSSQYLDSVTKMYESELEQLNQAASQELVYRMDAQKNVQSALGNKAHYEAQRDGYRYQEAQMDYNTAVQAGQAGVQNMWSGLQTGIGAAMEGYGAIQERNMQYDIAGVKRPDSWYRSRYMERYGTDKYIGRFGKTKYNRHY